MSRNRWKSRVLGGLLTLAAGGGCKQQLFMEKGDYIDAVRYGLPKDLDTNIHSAITPPAIERHGDGPPTVDDPARLRRLITLKECIALAIEQGSVGNQSENQFGFKSESIGTFGGQVQTESGPVRALALNPAIVGTELERSVAKFDARWITSMSWQKVDQPVAAQFLSFQQQRDAANFSSTLVKPLPTGGVAGITFSTDYSKFTTGSTQSGFVNPNYTPRLTFNFEQPLLRLFGVEVNQISNIAPLAEGTQLNLQGARPTSGAREGILISRIRQDQSRSEYERQINFTLANVETAYWNLYAAYYNMYAQEEGLRQSFEGYRFTKTRVDAGTDPVTQLHQAQAQFARFRGQVFRARGQVLESERQLRGLLGLRSDDGYLLVPIDEPNLAPYKPDYYEAANDAVVYRPEVQLVRQALKAVQLNLRLQRDLRRPDLRGFAQYDIAGLGTRLDGPEFTDAAQTRQGNALTSFGNNQFNSWTLGVRLDMPLGFRDANAVVRGAQLELTRHYYLLRDQELKMLESVTREYRGVVEAYKLIGPLQEEREQLQYYLAKFKTQIEVGRFTTTEYFNYLQVQRDLANAIAQEFQAIANYNSALAKLEFARGTILRYNNITIGEGPLPAWVGKRAADHQREVTEAALKLRERPVVHGGGVTGGHEVGPAIGTPFIGSLPPFAEKRDPVPEQLPDDQGPQKLPEKMGPPQPLPNPMPMPKGGTVPGGPNAARPWPTTTTGSNAGGGAVQPLPYPTRQQIGEVGGPTVAPGEYFQNDGTVTIPKRAPLTRPPASGVPVGQSNTEVPPITGGTRVPPIPRSSPLPPIPTLPGGGNP